MDLLIDVQPDSGLTQQYLVRPPSADELKGGLGVVLAALLV